MPLKRTSALIAAVLAAGLGLTACDNDSSSTAAATASASTAAATSSTAPAAPTTAASAPAAAPSAATQPAAAPATPAPGGAVPTNAVLNGKTRPVDLPADIPLPAGKITTVNGATGGYIITCEAAAGDYAKYEAALKAAGFEVSPMGDGSSLAEKGESNLLVTSSSTTITVTYAKI